MNRLLSPTAALALSFTCFLSPAAAGENVRDFDLEPSGEWSLREDGAARTPPMGFNSWNAFRADISESKMIEVAQAMIDTGLRDAGYNYVNLDAGWMLRRRQSDLRLVVNTRLFPSARTSKTEGEDYTDFRPYVDTLHGMGFRAGIYSDLGRNLCMQQNRPDDPNIPQGSRAEKEVGLYGNVERDIELFFGEWGFDYIKVDACGLNGFGPDKPKVQSGEFRTLGPVVYSGYPNLTDLKEIESLYASVYSALQKSNQDQDWVHSICLWGQGNSRSWGRTLGQTWRTSQDIFPNWTRMLHTFDTAATRALYAGPGHWNDPDMLEVGTGDFSVENLTEARSHFALWSILAAPLLIGFDLRDAPQPLVEILGNREAIRINQDPAGHQGTLVIDSDDAQLIVKTMSIDGEKAFVFFNRGHKPVSLDLTAEMLGMAKGTDIALTDVWSGNEVNRFRGKTVIAASPREAIYMVARGTPAIDGFLLGELPGRINVAEDGVARPFSDPLPHRMATASEKSNLRRTKRPDYPGFGGPRVDHNVFGTPITVDGRTWSKGIGILANSRLEVKLGGEFKRFSSSVALDDSTHNPDDRVTFRVYGDGRLLAEHTGVEFRAAESFDVDVSGVDVLELVALGSDDARLMSAVAWGDAKLLR